MTEKNQFERISQINVNEHTEKKNGLTYLSWAWAWSIFKKEYPEATYEIEKFNNLPYVYDPLTGYMVYTKVTAGNQTHEMWLPVMDGANKAMKAEPYTYQVKSYKGPIEKTCEAASMFDVNKTIMRCLVKNLAMFGLGLYIYSGEDLPETNQDETTGEPKAAPRRTTKPSAETAAEATKTAQGTPMNDATKAVVEMLDTKIQDWMLRRFNHSSLDEVTQEEADATLKAMNERKKNNE